MSKRVSFIAGLLGKEWRRAQESCLPGRTRGASGFSIRYFLFGFLALAVCAYTALSPFRAEGGKPLPPDRDTFCIVNGHNKPVLVYLSARTIRIPDKTVLLQSGTSECFNWEDYEEVSVLCDGKGDRRSKVKKVERRTEYVINYSVDEDCPSITKN